MKTENLQALKINKLTDAQYTREKAAGRLDGSALYLTPANNVTKTEFDSHTHNYAGSSSAGGAATSANKVNKSLTMTLNSGTTEGTNKFTFDGSAAKSVNITPSAIGAAASSHGTHVSYSTTAPVMDGTASAGSASTVARSDHKHPTDTSRASASSVTTLQGLVGDTKVSTQISNAISNAIEDVVYADENSVDTSAEVINADTIGGRPASDFAPAGYGLGEEQCTKISDLNDATYNGWYHVYNATNVPSRSNYGILFVSSSSRNFIRQDFYTGLTYPEHWVRYYTDDGYGNFSWKSWICEEPEMVSGIEYVTTDRLDGNYIHKKYDSNSGKVLYRLNDVDEWKSQYGLMGAAPASYIDEVINFGSDSELDSWIRATYNKLTPFTKYSALVGITNIDGKLPSAEYHMDLVKISDAMSIRAKCGSMLYSRYYAASNNSFTSWLLQGANGPSGDVNSVGWYRIGYLAYPASFTISISSIYGNTQDTVATVEACTAHGVASLFKIGMLPRSTFDQIRLVYDSSKGIFYVDFHYNQNLNNYMMTSMRPSNGSNAYCRPYENIAYIPDSSIGGTVVATISLT